MKEEFDKDELKELVNVFQTTTAQHAKALVDTEHMDDDDFNEETYDLAISIEESKTEIREYVREHMEVVKVLRTKYSILALEITLEEEV